MQRLQVVEFLRGWSILTIVLMHYLYDNVPRFMQTFLSFGGAGVHIFVLISGFGLYISHLRHNYTYLTYLKRRANRVYVPYLIILPFYIFLEYQQGNPIDGIIISSHIFLFKMFNAELDISLEFAFWFISMIIQFYVFWPIILRIFKRKGLWISYIISFAWIVLCLLLGKENNIVFNKFFLQYLWEFVLGMYLAKKYAEYSYEKIKIKYGLLWLLGGALLGCGLTFLMTSHGTILKAFNDVPNMIGYLSIALLVYKIKYINLFVLKFISEISYEFYLIHMLVYRMFFDVFDGCGTIMRLIIVLCCFFISLVLSRIYHITLKKIGV